MQWTDGTGIKVIPVGGAADNRASVDPDDIKPVGATADAGYGKRDMASSRSPLFQALSRMDERVEPLIAGDAPPHEFIRRFFSHIGWTKADFVAFVRERRAYFAHSLAASLHNPLTHRRVPRISHRIWLTSADAPAMPPDEYMQAVFTSIKKLPADWTNFFWTNSDAVALHVKSLARASGCSLVPQDIGLFSGGRVDALVGQLLAARKFVLAADLLKFLVLERFGGIYSDLGLVYSQEILDVAEVSDYCVLLVDAAFFQTSFLACAAQAPMISLFLAILGHPEALDRRYAISGPRVGAPDEVNMLAGPGFTVCALLFTPAQARLAIMPPQSEYLSWRSQQSWYGAEGKHGNVLIKDTQATIVSDERYEALGSVEEQNIKRFGALGPLGEKIRILAALDVHFDAKPTLLCDILRYNGSDKAKSWHNYGYFYAYILDRFIGKRARVLEVGLSAHAGAPSSAARERTAPGASLRALREYFLDAELVGAYSDRGSLFEDKGIQTFFVDQASSASFVDLFRGTGDAPFDLIIDDGLHTFAASRRTLLSSFSHLAVGGLYIVEDIMNADVEAWERFLPQLGLPAMIVKLPHQHNQNDNRLVVIVRT